MIAFAKSTAFASGAGRHWRGILAATVLLAMAGGVTLAETAPAPIQSIFNNGNDGAVRNQPTRDTEFTLSAPTRIVKITTYHWNDARGAPLGTIAIRSSTGRIYGPWQSTGAPGQGGVPNAYWIATIDVTLPAGTYTILDSDPATWSQNDGTDGAGMASIDGAAAIMPPAQPPAGVCDPSFAGKYSVLLRQIYVPQDQARFGACYEYGPFQGTSYMGQTGLPPGAFWTYAAPTWYIWSRRGGAPDEGPTPPATPPSSEAPPPSPPATTPPPAPPRTAVTLFNNGNVYAVRNRPTRMTVFAVAAPTFIAKIATYHWNFGRGAPLGTIALRSASGELYGPWPAAGLPGQGGVPNAYWVVNPNIVLPPGTYTILDSDFGTWSQNAGTGGAGIATIDGYAE